MKINLACMMVFDNIYIMEEKKFYSDLEKMIGAKEYSDVLFLIGSDKEPVYAHKVILSPRVEYFEKMFNSEMKETNDAQITFPHVDIKYFMRILRYIYTDKIQFDDIYMAIKIFVVANEWMFESLKDKCILYITDDIDKDNIRYIIKYAIVYEQIHDIMMKEINRIPMEYLLAINIKRLPFEYFIKFIKALNIKEIDKFHMLYNYSTLTDDVNIKNIEQNLLDIISFDRISYSSLVQVIYPKNILPDAIMNQMLINNSRKKRIYIKYKPNDKKIFSLQHKRFTFLMFNFKLQIIVDNECGMLIYYK